MKKNAHLGITIDPELHAKLKFVSKFEGRSMSGQILYLITTCVREYEKKYGKITEEDVRGLE